MLFAAPASTASSAVIKPIGRVNTPLPIDALTENLSKLLGHSKVGVPKEYLLNENDAVDEYVSELTFLSLQNTVSSKYEVYPVSDK